MTDIAREQAALAGQGLEIFTREAWDAEQNYTSARSVDEPASWFFLHISVTIDAGNTGLSEADDMRDIERIGQQRFGIGFPYNAAIFDTGRLYEGQPLTRRGAHTVNDRHIAGFPMPPLSLNVGGRAIVLPQMVDDDVTDVQIDQAARWAAAQKRSGLARRDAPWFGHRDFAFKSCPGDTGYDRLPDLRALTEHYTVHGLGDWLDMVTEAQLDAKLAGMEARIVQQIIGNKPVVVAFDDVIPGNPDHWFLSDGIERQEVTRTEAAQEVAQGNARWWARNPDGSWVEEPLRVPRATLEAVPLVE